MRIKTLATAGLLLGAVFLSACTQAIGAVSYGIRTDAEFNKLVLADVIEAGKLAAATNDVLAMKCWSYLEGFTREHAPGAEALSGEAVGVFSAYQRARNLRRTVIEVEISDSFRLECGPMLTDTMGALGRIGIRLVL